MNIVVVGGGAGTARLLAGLKAQCGDEGAESVTAVVSTGGDIRLHNLHVSTDLDGCLYASADTAAADDPAIPRDETYFVATELDRYGAEAPWFRIGDKAMATHLMRTRMLDAGYPLSQVTAALCAHWRTGIRLLPMTDDRVETHVVIAAPQDDPAPGTDERPGSGEHAWSGIADPATSPDADAPIVAIHLREWQRHFRSRPKPLAITPIGAENAVPAPGVVHAITSADLVVIGPDNPVTVIDSVMAVPGIRDAIAETSARVIGIAPVAAGRPVTADALDGVGAAGIDTTARGVLDYYGARGAGGLVDGWLCDVDDDPAGTDPAPAPCFARTRLDVAGMQSARLVAAALLAVAGD